MILPDNIKPENSIYYTSAMILAALQERKGQAIEDLYYEVCKKSPMNFNVFLLSMDWLYLIGATTNE